MAHLAISLSLEEVNWAVHFSWAAEYSCLPTSTPDRWVATARSIECCFLLQCQSLSAQNCSWHLIFWWQHLCLAAAGVPLPSFCLPTASPGASLQSTGPAPSTSLTPASPGLPRLGEDAGGGKHLLLPRSVVGGKCQCTVKEGVDKLLGGGTSFQVSHRWVPRTGIQHTPLFPYLFRHCCTRGVLHTHDTHLCKTQPLVFSSSHQQKYDICTQSGTSYTKFWLVLMKDEAKLWEP